VEQMMGRGIILTELLIKEKAQEFAQLLEISEEELSFSNGWISRFKMRNHLRSFRFHGEANSAPLETLSEERNKLRSLLSMYNINDIYNADETGLFFRMAPNQTLARSASAGKKTCKWNIAYNKACSYYKTC